MSKPKPKVNRSEKKKLLKVLGSSQMKRFNDAHSDESDRKDENIKAFQIEKHWKVRRIFSAWFLIIIYTFLFVQWILTLSKGDTSKVGLFCIIVYMLLGLLSISIAV